MNALLGMLIGSLVAQYIIVLGSFFDNKQHTFKSKKMFLFWLVPIIPFLVWMTVHIPSKVIDAWNSLGQGDSNA